MGKKLSAPMIACLRAAPFIQTYGPGGKPNPFPDGVGSRSLTAAVDRGLIHTWYEVGDDLWVFAVTEAGKKALASLPLADQLAASLAVTKEKK